MSKAITEDTGWERGHRDLLAVVAAALLERRVRTPEGAAHYDQPIDSVIVADPIAYLPDEHWTSTRAPEEERDRVRALAIERAKRVPRPSRAMIADNKARIIEDPMLRSGSTDLRGNRYQEDDRAWTLFQIFGGLDHGDAETGWVACVYCGAKLSWYSKGPNGKMAPFPRMEQDKILTTGSGGKYKTWNIVPSCRACNQKRGNKPFHEGDDLEDAKPDWWEAHQALVKRTRPKRSPQRGLTKPDEPSGAQKPWWGKRARKDKS